MGRYAGVTSRGGYNNLMGGVVLRRLLLLFLAVGLLFSSCINRFDSAPTEAEAIDVEYNITLERLNQQVTSSGCYDVREELIVKGSVTATDESGNFYKLFVIEQDGYALEVLEGLTYSYVRHDEGYVMVVYLEGLRLSRSRGVLQLGVAASESSYYDLDYMEHEIVVDRHILNTGVVESVTPREITREELDSESLVEELCGSLVSIGGLRLVVDEESSDATLWGGTVEFVDVEGRTLGCYTSSYADFSMCEIPEGEVTLVGILQYDYSSGASSPMIKLRREDDCIEYEE
ncbi:MAG: DUF5689 domain-containing protein [Rikenellaceae bacterium]